MTLYFENYNIQLVYKQSYPTGYFVQIFVFSQKRKEKENKEMKHVET